MDKWVAKLDRLYPQLRNKWCKCHFCGRPTTEIHHIKPRDNLLIRYDLHNLLPLCHDCHSLIHLKKIEMYLPMFRVDYLNKMMNIQFQDYLLEHNLTRDEFFAKKEKELKEAINGKPGFLQRLSRFAIFNH